MLVLAFFLFLSNLMMLKCAHFTPVESMHCALPGIFAPNGTDLKLNMVFLRLIAKYPAVSSPFYNGWQFGQK